MAQPELKEKSRRQFDSPQLSDLHRLRSRLYGLLVKVLGKDAATKIYGAKLDPKFDALRYTIDQLEIEFRTTAQIYYSGMQLCNQSTIPHRTIISAPEERSNENIATSKHSPSTDARQEVLSILRQRYPVGADNIIRLFDSLKVANQDRQYVYAQLHHYLQGSQFALPAEWSNPFERDPEIQQKVGAIFKSEAFAAFVQPEYGQILKQRAQELQRRYETRLVAEGTEDDMLAGIDMRIVVNPQPATNPERSANTKLVHGLNTLMGRLVECSDVQSLIAFFVFWETTDFPADIRSVFQPLFDEYQIALQ